MNASSTFLWGKRWIALAGLYTLWMVSCGEGPASSRQDTFGLDLTLVAARDQLPTRVLDPAGNRTRESVAAITRRYGAGFKVLYNRFSRERPEVGAGAITVIFSIDPTGRVNDASILKSDFAEYSEFEETLLERVYRLRFVPMEGESDVVVEFPMSFKPLPKEESDSPARVQ